MEPVEEEPSRKRKEKYGKLAIKSAKETTGECNAAQAMHSFAEIAQLKEALASCAQQME